MQNFILSTVSGHIDPQRVNPPKPTCSGSVEGYPRCPSSTLVTQRVHVYCSDILTVMIIYIYIYICSPRVIHPLGEKGVLDRMVRLTGRGAASAWTLGTP